MTPTPSPVIVHPQQGATLRAFGDEIIVKLSGAQTGGAFCLCLDTTPPGGGPPPHIHTREDELFILQEGRASFLIQGRWIDVRPGAAIYVPRGAVHTFRNVGTTPCRQWILTMPAGFEDFFARCAAEFAKAEGPSMDRILQIGAEHGIQFLESEDRREPTARLESETELVSLRR